MPGDNKDPTETQNDEILTPRQDPIETAPGGNEDPVITADAENAADMDDEEEDGPSELDVLKVRARTLGVSHSPNILPATLRAKIDEHIAKLEEAQLPKSVRQEEINNGTTDEPVRALQKPQVLPASARTKLPHMSEMLDMSTDDLMRQPVKRRTQIIRARQRHVELALVRCQIHCNNPNKNDLHGEIFSVQNKYVGIVRKFIPYGKFTENGYHVPRMLIKMLKAKKYLQVRSVKSSDGTERTETSLAPEFTINELRPLTAAELKQLAAMQAARSSTDAGFVGQ